MSKTPAEIIAGTPVVGDTRFHVGAETTAAILVELDAADLVIVRKLRRGETPGKIAAWQAFLKAMAHEMPRNADGTYNGTFDHAVQEAIQAYILAEGA